MKIILLIQICKQIYNQAMQNKDIRNLYMKIKILSINRVFSAHFPRKINKFIQIPLQTPKLANKIYRLKILNQQKEKAAVVRVFSETSLRIQEMKRILKPNVIAINQSRQILLKILIKLKKRWLGKFDFQRKKVQKVIAMGRN